MGLRKVATYLVVVSGAFGGLMLGGACNAPAPATEKVGAAPQAISGTGGSGGSGGGASCACMGGVDSDGNAVDPASTFCGFSVCGEDGSEWTCQADGWEGPGQDCGGTASTGSGSCSCAGGVDNHGNAVDPAQTSCGFSVCGQDENVYTCGASGWTEAPEPQCAGGVDINGNAIDPAQTGCGFTACGGDAQVYECTATGWEATGTSCSGSTSSGGSCSCSGGADANGNPIDPADTSCGFTVCGEDHNEYACQSDGWEATGNGC